jgi:hypothetical protein
MFDDVRAIGAVREPKVQDLRVVLRLLKAVSRQAVLRFGFDDRERSVSGVRKQVINSLALAAANRPAAYDDPTRSEGHLLANLIVFPPCGVKTGEDVCPTGISLRRH